MSIPINTQVLLALRDRSKWSQEELATAAGLSTRTVQRAEAGADASLETIRALAAALDTDQAFLVTRSDPIKAGYTVSENKRERFWCVFFTTLGCLCAYAGITYSMLIGHTPARYAGLSMGILGALCGGFCFLMSRYYERRAARADPD